MSMAKERAFNTTSSSYHVLFSSSFLKLQRDCVNKPPNWNKLKRCQSILPVQEHQMRSSCSRQDFQAPHHNGEFSDSGRIHALEGSVVQGEQWPSLLKVEEIALTNVEKEVS